MVKVVDGKRINFNYNKDPEAVGEIADPAVVKRRLEKEGCSVRLLHPQRTQVPTSFSPQRTTKTSNYTF